MSLVKTNVKGYLKDPKTNVVINDNDDEYLAYKTQIDRYSEHVRLKNEICELKDQLAEIKQLLLERKK